MAGDYARDVLWKVGGEAEELAAAEAGRVFYVIKRYGGVLS